MVYAALAQCPVIGGTVAGVDAAAARAMPGVRDVIDIGEGVAEGEIVKWLVDVGATVKEHQAIAEVMTDKATVEIPAPVSGRVVSLTGQPGDMVRVGSERVVFETDAADDDVVAPAAAVPATAPAQPAEVLSSPVVPATSPAQAVEVSSEAGQVSGRVKASPATRRKARRCRLAAR